MPTEATTEEVWARFHASLTRFVSRRVKRPVDVDDIVQQVFVRVHVGLPRLRDQDRVHAWIFRTARNAIADYYRAPGARREIAVGDLGDVDAAAGVPVGADEDTGAMAELSRCLEPLLAGIPARDVAILNLIEVEGLSQAAAARQAGISLSGMKSRVQRARARLRDAVEDCCRVELDRRGGIVAYESRRPSPCGCTSPAPASAGRADARRRPSAEPDGVRPGNRPRP
mgnify:CR=1 FL=1